MRLHRLICALLGVVLLSGCPKEEAPPAQAPAPGGPLRTYVLVIDGLAPENISPVHTPSLCRIAPCAGTPRGNGPSRGTVYAQARSGMLTQTNANHIAMMAGVYGDVSGAIGNAFYDRRTQSIVPLIDPAMILVPTVFDVLGKLNADAEGG